MKIKSLFTFLFLINITAYSQQTTMDSLSGNYSMNSFLFQRYLTLKSDSTFSYSFSLQKPKMFEEPITNGKWMLVNNNIILNSEIQPVHFKDSVAQKKANTPFTTIEIKDKLNKPYENLNCFISIDHKIKEFKTDSLGKIIINEGNINQIIFKNIRQKELKFKVNPINNLFEIYLDSESIYYRYFTNEVWILKNNEIINPTHKFMKGEIKKTYTKDN